MKEILHCFLLVSIPAFHSQRWMFFPVPNLKHWALIGWLLMGFFENQANYYLFIHMDVFCL